jgi:tape measure domain-containing protein
MEGGDLRMSSVDQRVVEMKFDRNDFSKGVQGTLDELALLKQNLKLEGASQGLSEAANGMSQLGENTSGISGKFSALGAVAFGALASIGAKAVAVGQQLISSLTVDPISSGLQEYETNLNAVQTILANTQVSGAGLPEVNAALNDLNHYSDLTIYNFSEMAKNIGTFTAAGVGLDQATNSIKGIANLAALSGSNSEQASTAMYQLSQAISSGKVSLQDWNSVVNAGMGGTVFQRALAQTAVSMGTLNDSAVRLEGPMQNVTIAGQSFRESLDATNGPAWLTSDVLTNTLSQFTGDLTDAQLAAQGFSAEQVAAIQQTAQTAFHAATEVKTLSGVLDVAKEAAGSGWSQTWQIIFGDFDEAKSTFTDLSNTITGMINSSAQSRNAMLQDWKDLGGRTVLIDGLKAAFAALGGVIAPIKEAFRDIFPATTGKELYNATVKFRDFMQSLKPSAETVDRIKRTFEGLFAVLHIGWTIIKSVVGFIFDMFGSISSGSGGILKVTANMGDFLVKIDNFLNKGQYVQRFFDWLHDALMRIIDPIKNAGGSLGGMFGGLEGSAAGAHKVLDSLRQMLDHIHTIGDQAGSAWDKFVQIMHVIWDKVQPILEKVKEGIGNFVSWIADAFSHISFGDILGAAGVGGLVGLVLVLKKGISSIKDMFSHPQGPGLFDSVKESLEQLTGTLKSMQTMLKAATLLEIAAAIALLTVAVSVLSKIDPAALGIATAAIATMLVQLTGTMVIMDKAMKRAKAMKMDQIALGMILVATAVDILASAVKKMAGLSWNDLAKGISATVVLLAALAGTVRLMGTNNKRMISTGIGLTLIASAVRILVTAVKEFSDMNWGDLAKGLTGVVVVLGALALYSRFSGSTGVFSGVGVVLIATGIRILVSAIQDFSKMSWVELAKGMSAMSVGLAAIAAALKLIPASSLLRAAGVIVVAASLSLIADAIKDISKLSWNEIAKGIAGIAVALAAIAAALKLLPAKSLLTGIAILEVAASLGMIADAIHELGENSWNEIAKGLTALAVALVAIGAALKLLPAKSVITGSAIFIVAEALGPIADALDQMAKNSWGEVARGLVELAGALVIIGAALFLLPPSSILSAAAILIAAQALSTIGDALKDMSKMSWGEIAKSLVELAGALLIIGIALAAMSADILGAATLVIVAGALSILADVLVKLGAMSWSDIGAAIAQLALLFVVLAIGGALSPLILLLGGALMVLAGAIALAGAGVSALGNGFNAFADAMDKLSKIDSAGLDRITDALKALIGLLPVLATSVADSITNFITEFANRTPEMAAAVGTAVVATAQEVAKDMPQVVNAFVQGLTDTLNAMANKVPDFIKAGADLIVNTLTGIANNMGRVISSGVDVIVAFLKGIGDNAKRVSDAGFQMIIDVMNGIADSIRQHAQQMRDAAANIGDAILDGIFGGVNNSKKRGSIMDSIKGLATGALNSFKNMLGIKSPSTEFAEAGRFVVEGFALGLDQYGSTATSAAKSLGGDVLSTMGKTISGLGNLISDHMDEINPVVAPVLDLSNIQRDSSMIGQILQTTPINLDNAYSQARVASSGQLENQAVLADLAEAAARESISFTQNNYSPKALSAVELYRQTNNQLSVMKGVLSK